ncbi:MAG: autotransporter domain-containing protein [Sphingomonas sp.]
MTTMNASGRRARLFCAALLGSTALAASPAAAQSWTGANSKDWKDGANWSTGTAPDGFSNVHIDTTAPNTTEISSEEVYAGNVVVGDAAQGALTVNAGGKLHNASRLWIGFANGANGTVVVSGAGSLYDNNGSLSGPGLPPATIVGAAGKGTLSVLAGAEFDDFALYAGDSVGASGTVTIAGAGTKMNLDGLYSGNSGVGSVTVAGGAQLVTAVGTLGAGSGSLGSVVVAGGGSSWQSQDIDVGGDGLGALTLQAGGLVAATDRLKVGAGAGNGGTVSIDGVGSELSALDLDIGVGSKGTVSVTGGGTLRADATTTLGADFGITGRLTVDGPQSQFQANDVMLGTGGTGVFILSNGAKTSATGNIMVGVGQGTLGTVNVTGPGSVLNVDKVFDVGRYSAGEAYILNGAQLNATLAIGVGDVAGSNGVLEIDGASANTAVLVLGDSGTGSVHMTNGAQLQANDAVLGYAAQSNGSLALDKGALVSIMNTATVGYDGAATILISNGAALNVNAGGILGGGTLDLGLDAGSSGGIIIGATGQTTTGSGALNVAKIEIGAGSGSIAFNHNDTNYVFAAAIEGGDSQRGNIAVLGGFTTLTADSSGYHGETFVQANSGIDTGLNITGKLGGFVAVGGDGLTKVSLLTGSGALTGDVEILNNGTLLGQTGHTLTFGSLKLDAGALLQVDLEAAGDPALFQVNGNLTLDGTLNSFSVLPFGQGVYRIFDYGGMLTDNGLVFGTLPSGTFASNFVIQTSVSGQVNLVYMGPGAGAGSVAFWDGDGAGNAGNGKVDGGNGLWSASSTNFTDANGALTTTYAKDVVFQGQAGIVRADNSAGQLTVDSMQFASDGYFLQGDALQLGQKTVVRVGNGTASGNQYVATIGNVLTGTGSLYKDDYGTLVLYGNSDYTGGTTVAAGTLQIGSGDSFGSIGGDVVNNGTLAFDRFDAYAFGGVISGSGIVRQIGDGTLSLSAHETYFGATDIANGTLALSGAGDISSSSGIHAEAGGTFDISALSAGTTIQDLSGAGHVVLGTNTLTIANAASDFDGAISGTGGLHLAAGVLGLNGASSYTGGTTIDSGATLILNDGGTGGSISGNVIDNGALYFGHPDDYSFAGAISGSGLIDQGQTGVLTLTGTNSYSGGTIIESGTIRGTSNSLQGAILDNSHLVFDQDFDGSFGGSIQGGGDLTKAGKGALTLVNGALYSGATTVQGGALIVLGGLPNSDVAVSAGLLGGYGPLRSLTMTGGTLAPGQSPGTMIVLGNASLGAGSTYAVDLAGAASDLLLVGGSVTLGGGTLSLSGTPKFGVTYEIISAQGGVTGTFGTIDGAISKPFMATLVDYKPDAVFVTLAPNDPAILAAARTRNQLAAAHGVTDLPLADPIVAAVADLDGATAPAAFDQLSGEIHASLRGAITEDARAAGERLLDAIGTRRGLWGEATAGSRHIAGDGNAATVRGSIRSILTGVDGGSDDVRVGLVFGYGWDDVDVAARDSSARVEALRLGAYLHAAPGDGLEIKAASLYSRWRGDIRRAISIPGYSDQLASVDRADMMQGLAELGWTGRLGKVRFGPFAAIDWVGLEGSSVAESGGAAALIGRSRRQDSWFGKLGVRGSTDFALRGFTLTPSGSVSWEGAFRDRLPTVDLNFASLPSGTAYAVNGPIAPRDRLGAELGLSATGKTLDVGIGVGGSYAERTAQTNVRLHLRWQF